MLGPPPSIQEVLRARVVEQNRVSYASCIKCLYTITVALLELFIVKYPRTPEGLPLKRMKVLVELPKTALRPSDVSITVTVEYGSEIFSKIHEYPFNLTQFVEEECLSILTNYSSLYCFICVMKSALERMGVDVEIAEQARPMIF